MRDIEVEGEAVEPAPRRAGKRYALVIGIDHYDEPQFPSLKFAVQDAKAMAERLSQDFGFQAAFLSDDGATSAAIRDVLDGWQANTQPEDNVLIYFAGHGTQRPGPGGQPQGYLIPVDSGQDWHTWLVEADLIERVKNLPARRGLLLFDACYSGAALRVADSIPPNVPTDRVLKILVAGTEEQRVPDGGAGLHSIFTKALLDGLDGLADTGQSPDGIIAASELIPFVRSEVAWRNQVRGSTETPVGGTLLGMPGGDDFEFVPAKPRLSALILRNLCSNEAAGRLAAAVQLKQHRRSATADLAAQELIGLAYNIRPPEGPNKMNPGELLDVRKTAIASLGELGHPKGFDVLIDLLDREAPAGLRAPAASALGVLAGKPEPAAGYNVTRLRRKALKRLIGVLCDVDRGVQDAAKDSLSDIPDSAHLLRAALKAAHKPSPAAQAGTGGAKQIVDTLARLADHHPDNDAAWPELDTVRDRFWRRIYLAWCRIRPHRIDLVRRMVGVGLSAAVGLALAFAIVLSAIHWGEYALLYGSAALSVAALPGAAAGVAFVLAPFLGSALSRRSRTVAGVVGALVAGLSFGIWMGIPDWFWGIGKGAGGCGTHTWLCQLLPGLVVGPILGLALVSLPWKVPSLPEKARGGYGAARATLGKNVPWLLVVTIASAVVMAALKIPRPLSFRAFEPHWFEVLWWGVGGACLGAALAVGWCASCVRATQGGDKP
jgi:hypothetical protein